METTNDEQKSREFLIKDMSDLGKLVDLVFDDIVRIDTDNQAKVIALQGDLGVGKTTFTKILAEKLGIKEMVSSPTFSIYKKYLIPAPIPNLSLKNNQYQPSTLLHLDAYRLEDSNELKKLKFEYELANHLNLIVIEWPELVKDILPRHLIWVRFEHQDEGVRKVTLEPYL